jgi:hypothetical protein
MDNKTDAQKQEFILRRENQTSATSEKQRGFFGRMKDRLDEWPSGVRRQTEMVNAHTELFKATTIAVEALHYLDKTEDRLRKEDAQADRDHEIAMKDREVKLQEAEVKLKALGREQKLVDDECDLRQTKLRDDIDKIKQGGQSGTKQKQESESERQRRRYREQADQAIWRAQMMHGDKQKQFAEIDELVKSGKLTPEDAQYLKDQIQRIYEDASMKK